MKNITATFGTLYHPIKAFVIYQQDASDTGIYIEAYDMDKNGYPINAHPLSVQESTRLAKALDTSEQRKHKFLTPAGLLPKNVLYLNSDQNGCAVWYTPAQTVNLLFVDNLTIPNGKASLPPLLWKASKNSLHLYALFTVADLSPQTVLAHAPFFNLYEDGRVCMGTVSINIKGNCLLEAFIDQWEQYFFNSYFSHMIRDKSPVKGNITTLWQSLVNSRKRFPIQALLKNGLTLQHLLS
jgi:PRTRC genetic system protein B